jgi:hypothetical protein
MEDGFRLTSNGPTALDSSTQVLAYSRGALAIELIRHLGAWHLEVVLGCEHSHNFDLDTISAAVTGTAIELEPMPLDRQCAVVRRHASDMDRLASTVEFDLAMNALNALRETRARVRMPGLYQAP